MEKERGVRGALGAGGRGGSESVTKLETETKRWEQHGYRCEMGIEALRQGTALSRELSRPAQTMCSPSLPLRRITNHPLPRVWAFIREGALVRERGRLRLGERAENQERVERARGMLESRTKNCRGAHR
jgi:hypothetical protein